MNNWKCAIALVTCCGIVLTIAPSASADFVGVTTVIKDDPNGLCAGTAEPPPPNQQVFSPLTVCNVFAAFGNPNDVLLSVGNADLQVYNGAIPDVFFQHPFNAAVIAPTCFFIEFVAPDLICDTFITIGYKCGPDPAGTDATGPDGDFDGVEFANNGHLVGGWFNASWPNGQGHAGTWPDLQVFFLQSSVAQGLSLSGDIDLFWWAEAHGDVYAEIDVPLECAAGCPDDYPCDDGDACTEKDQCIDGVCTGVPISCVDGNPCTDDDCDPDSGCTHTPNNGPCDDGDACTTGDHCGDDGCVQGGPPVDCDDGDECTEDSCDSETGCVHTHFDCEDGNECTDDDCDPDTGCTHTPNNNPCDDGDACTVNDQCGEDGCVHGGGPLDCDDGNECTDDDCDPYTGCTYTPNNDPCDDGDACTENDQCGKNACVHGTPIDCDDGNACTDDGCDPDRGCTHVDIECPNGQSCDPASGECVEDQDPCACDDGRVTLCHIPPGNSAKARTITVGCAARDRHLAHGDTCGPCEGGDG